MFLGDVTFHHAFISAWEVYDAHQIQPRGGDRRSGSLYIYSLVLSSFALHASLDFATSFVRMTVATALLQATSLFSNLSQVYTNGKHP